MEVYLSFSLALCIHLPVVSLMYSVVVAACHFACISYQRQPKALFFTTATSTSHCINILLHIFQATMG